MQGIGSLHKEHPGTYIAGVIAGAFLGGTLLRFVPDTSSSGKDLRLVKGLGAMAAGTALSMIDSTLVKAIGLGVLSSGVYKTGQKFNLIGDINNAVGLLPSPQEYMQQPTSSAIGAASQAEDLMAIGMF